MIEKSFQKSFIPPQVKKFVYYMRIERDLSETTIYFRQTELRRFFSQIKQESGQFLAHLTPAHLDAILIHKFNQRIYAPATIKNFGHTLRVFFRYAEHQGWCRSGIADSIQTPRIYKYATLPVAPTWEEVQRLIKTTEGNRPSDIRARAIILLLAIYGLRNSEVRQLRLEDFDWEQKTFRLKHSKRGPTQQMPLLPTVGQALIRYIKNVRPKRSAKRELFLTLHAPYRPLGDIWELVSSRWRKLNISIKHHGPHTLRHACATRLINRGVPFKTIADQLGHRSLDTTKIYAKVDLPRLREVANFNLRGVL